MPEDISRKSKRKQPKPVFVKERLRNDK